MYLKIHFRVVKSARINPNQQASILLLYLILGFICLDVLQKTPVFNMVAAMVESYTQ